jgi:septin family protein
VKSADGGYWRLADDLTRFADDDRTHLQDLIESTALIHYEGFRAKQVSNIGTQLFLAFPADDKTSHSTKLTALKESSAKQAAAHAAGGQ